MATAEGWLRCSLAFHASSVETAPPASQELLRLMWELGRQERRWPFPFSALEESLGATPRSFRDLCRRAHADAAFSSLYEIVILQPLGDGAAHPPKERRPRAVAPA